jgi:signal transduction histidine kinase
LLAPPLTSQRRGYRTAQEALTNIRRHATPDQVAVRLDYQPDAVALVVEDHGAGAMAAVREAAAGDGSGMSAGAGTIPFAGAGYGLTGMRERAELLGGTLVAEPTDDGFRVQLVLPA